MYFIHMWFKKPVKEPEKMTNRQKDDEGAPVPKKLTPAARRALAEAELRRREADAAPARPVEINGRRGVEPTRYGDWEAKGILSDF